MLNSLVHQLLSVRGWPAYVIPAALCFGEAAIFLGFVIPGETAVVYGGVLASQHHVSLVIMVVAVVFAAILGDSVGYLVGRLFGPALLRHRRLRNHGGVQRARDFLQQKGGPAVFLGRFVALFRALMPGMAGASRLRYPTFFFFNALGGLVWGIAFTLIGYAVGRSYEAALRVIGDASTGLLIAVIVVLIGFVGFRHWHRRRDASADQSSTKPD